MKRRFKSLMLAASLVAGMIMLTGCGNEKEETTELWEKEHQMEEETAYYKKDTRYSYYTGEEALSAWIIYEYDSNGNMFKRTEYNELGEKGSIQANEYDEKGSPLTTSSYNKNGSLSYIYEYEYDQQDNITCKTWLDANSVALMETVYEYDDESRVIKETYTQGELTNYIISEYIEVSE